ncbi:MAG: hypothetical protein M1812_003546 [Candelaria pacifica]|nr:MAG: hypothetical protein M1812_003546 [Candelaria pacifica]
MHLVFFTQSRTLITVLTVLTTLAISSTTSIPPLTPRQTKAPGLSVIPGHCTPTDEATIKSAISLLPLILTAGVNAAKSWTEPPFNYFFKDYIQTAERVATIYNYASDAANGEGPPVGITCKDPTNRCRNAGQMAYATSDIIFICPLGLSLPSINIPCNGPPGIYNIVGLLLHELLHKTGITRTSEQISDSAVLLGPSEKDDKAKDVHALLVKGFDTTLIAKAYSFTASWAWELGLGVEPKGVSSSWDGKSCLGNFDRGNFDAPRWVIASADEIAGNQRLLLYGV